MRRYRGKTTVTQTRASGENRVSTKLGVIHGGAVAAGRGGDVRAAAGSVVAGPGGQHELALGGGPVEPPSSGTADSRRFHRGGCACQGLRRTASGPPAPSRWRCSGTS